MASGSRQPTLVVERPMSAIGKESVANSHPPVSPGDRKVSGGFCFWTSRSREWTPASTSACRSDAKQRCAATTLPSARLPPSRRRILQLLRSGRPCLPPWSRAAPACISAHDDASQDALVDQDNASSGGRRHPHPPRRCARRSIDCHRPHPSRGRMKTRTDSAGELSPLLPPPWATDVGHRVGIGGCTGRLRSTARSWRLG
jgi:hypothetical protein